MRPLARIAIGRGAVLVAALALGCNSGSTGSQVLRLEAASTTIQGGPAGQPVASRPSVRVVDASTGDAKSGIPVTFAVASGGGSITGASQTTNLNGVATVGSWTLGATPGLNTLTASAPVQQGSPVTFSSTGNAP